MDKWRLRNTQAGILEGFEWFDGKKTVKLRIDLWQYNDGKKHLAVIIDDYDLIVHVGDRLGNTFYDSRGIDDEEWVMRNEQAETPSLLEQARAKVRQARGETA